MKRIGSILFYLFLTTTIAPGCSQMKSSDFKNQTPQFILEEYFSGKTRAWGLFEDRFGNVKRQFVVDILGIWDGKVLTLEEYFSYHDGEKSFRRWKIEKTGEAKYEGTAGDVIGIASGVSSGNTLNWKYTLDLKISERSSMHVTFDDWMFLQPGNVLLNRAKLSKFGLDIGVVTITFMKVTD